MLAATRTAAQRGRRRWSPVTLLAAFVAALLLLGQTGSAAFADQPNGQPTPPTTTPDPKSDPASLTPDQQRIENVITAAKQYLGVPYRVGSEGPTLFDCSGLVFRAFSDVGLVDRIGGARLRAAGYLHWFASRGQMTTDESQAQRGDLVIYANGEHIGIYLGDGRAMSALINPFGVTVHSVHGVSLPVTGYLRPDWSGDGEVPPFVPVDLPVTEVPEAPATLVPAAAWMPALDPTITAPVERDGKERPDMRTLNSRTFENKDGTFTTEFHAQPIFYQPADTTLPEELQPLNLTFVPDELSAAPTVATSPVVVTTRPANDPAGVVSATAAGLALSLGLAPNAGMAPSKSMPQILDGGRVVDYFGFQPQEVGLRVLAQPDGFKTFLVFGKRPDKTRYSFVLNAPGLTPVVAEDGSVLLTNADGLTMGRIPRPLLLDSSDDDGNGGGVFTAAASLSVDTKGPLPVITVAIDRSFLEETVFPAYVDLSLTDFAQTNPGADVAFASSVHPNASLLGYQRPESAGFDELWLGHQPESRNDNEVFIRFAGLRAVLGTVDIASASLELLPYFQGAQAATTTVSRITADWQAAAVTWMTRPIVDTVSSQTATSTAGTWAELDVSNYVTNVLSHGMPDYGLALASDETAAGAWTRLAASDAGGTAEFGPRLVVTWSGLRPSTGGLPVGTPALKIAPRLTWWHPSINRDQWKYQVQVSRDGFATYVAESGTVKGAAGKTNAWQVPTSALKSSGTYSWRVRIKTSRDSGWSPWSNVQTFTFGLPARIDTPPHGVL